jgi:hypothetical protein
MKVKLPNRDYTLFTRYSWMKDHTANPDSNLVALNRAYDYWQPIWAFNDGFFVQKNVSEFREVQPLLRLPWFMPEKAWTANKWRFKIAVANSCGGRLSAFVSDEWCHFAPDNLNAASGFRENGLVVAEKMAKDCAQASAWQEESLLGNCPRQFARQKILGLCISLWC